MREAFVAAVRKALAETGLAAKDYADHSFRIGAAITAARQGMQDSLIKTLAGGKVLPTQDTLKLLQKHFVKCLSPSHLTFQ